LAAASALRSARAALFAGGFFAIAFDGIGLKRFPAFFAFFGFHGFFFFKIFYDSVLILPDPVKLAITYDQNAH
jgi:hypothetical protein